MPLTLIIDETAVRLVAIPIEPKPSLFHKPVKVPVLP